MMMMKEDDDDDTTTIWSTLRRGAGGRGSHPSGAHGGVAPAARLERVQARVAAAAAGGIADQRRVRLGQKCVVDRRRSRGGRRRGRGRSVVAAAKHAQRDVFVRIAAQLFRGWFGAGRERADDEDEHCAEQHAAGIAPPAFAFSALAADAEAASVAHWMFFAGTGGGAAGSRCWDYLLVCVGCHRACRKE